MDPEYVTGQINSCILELKILICFSLKCFPNKYKRYSSHLQVLILHQVAPTKVYLTIYDSLKNCYLKKFPYHKHFWVLANPQSKPPSPHPFHKRGMKTFEKWP